MSTVHHTRNSDSPYIFSVSHIMHTADNVGTALPDGCWDLVVLRQNDGSVNIFRTGMLTRAIPLERKAGEELLVISLRANIFMPHMSAQRLVDDAFVFPTFGKNAFSIDSTTVEIPSFGNVEMFVDKLVHTGILMSDKEVAATLEGTPKVTSPRTLQRHFLATTGVTWSYLQQIARAQRAAALLQQGASPSWAAAEAGYFDQAQMTRILKQMMGQTPGEIRRKGLNTTKNLS